MQRNVKSYINTVFLAFVSLVLAVCMFLNPQIVYEASLQGLKIWWDVVFPAVFPIMVLSEMMIGFGVVHFIGELLEPIMRPLFRVPGAGGFAMAMGFSSSYPVGAKLAALLREQKLVSRAEGERLVCFTSTADPLFILVAISVGIFQDATIGPVIAVANFAAAILLGIMLRYHDRHAPVTESSEAEKRVPLLRRAFQKMHRAQMEDKRPLGKLISDAVMSAFNTLFAIGVFMMMFSVIIKFITMGTVAELLAAPLALMLMFLQMPEQLAQSIIVGFFEVTQSMKSISDVPGFVDMKSKIVIASALVAWGGISVHAQVASIISTTDIRYQPYFIYKIVHAFLAGIIAFFLWEPLRGQETWIQGVMPVFGKVAAEGEYDFASVFVFYTGTFILLMILFALLTTAFRYLSSKMAR